MNESPDMRFALCESIQQQNLKLFDREPHMVIGKSVCIACGHEQSGVRADVRAAWVRCSVCDACTSMFVYRGKNSRNE